MKRVLLVLLVAVVTLTAATTSAFAPLAPFAGTTVSAADQQDPATITVYVTRTGEKYHRDGCRYLSRSKIATTLKEAVARGFTPCSVCKPPTVSTRQTSLGGNPG